MRDPFAQQGTSDATMAHSPPCQAVILAGGGGSRLYPLTASGLPKVLLPVANRPLLTFPLRTLEEAGITDVLVVCEGDGAASSVRSWVAHHPVGSLNIDVLRVAEGLPSVAALRLALERVRTESFVLLSGDVVTEVPLRVQLLAHHTRGAAVTALFGRRAASSVGDAHPGKAPRNVDYVGLADADRLVFFAHSPEPAKELRLPQSLLRQHPRVALTTRLTDMQVYVFATAVVAAVLEARPEMRRLEDDLLPYLVRRQACPPREVTAGALQRAASGISSMGSTMSLSALGDGDSLGGSVAGGQYFRGRMGGSASVGWLCTAYVAPEGSYCRRANTLGGYADVNRDAVTPEFAAKLLREAPTPRFDNFVAAGVTMGAKTTVGAGCMVGEECALGDKCSVKRSVIGRGCSLGAGVKVINSVIMDGVRLGDGCHVQNSVLCANSRLRDGVQLKDCQVGAEFEVPGGSDLKGEVLCLTPPPPPVGAK